MIEGNIGLDMRYLFALLFLLLGTSLVGAQKSLLQLDLEDLAQIQTADTASTLIKTQKKLSPSIVTTITQEQIQESGARTLDELLEIYVPDVAYMYKVDGNQLGIGGIISDRNNKILLVINGRVMNIKGRDGGAISERFFPLLGDIKKVQVISGPGSVIYGPGAIAGVISITTFDSKSFQGLQSNAALGYGENFGYIDLKYADRFSNDIGLFVYAGIDRYNGIDRDDVTNKFAFSYPDRDITAYEKYPRPTVNLNGWYKEKNRKKLHLELEKGDLKFWSRYTVSSLAIPTYQNFYISIPDELKDTGMENDQWCSMLSYEQNFSKLQLDYSLSYLHSELERRIRTSKQKKLNEENINAKILATYSYSDSAEYAVGTEYTKNRFIDYQNRFIPLFRTPASWNTELFSLYGEAKNRLSHNIITLFDARVDKHTYTNTLFSGRAAGIYTITKEDILKLNYSHSTRHADEIDLYRQYHEENKKPDIESIDRVELIYNKSVQHWDNSLRATYNIHDIVAYNNTIYKTAYLGTAKFYTIEAALNYKNDTYAFNLSHVYTSLLNFTLSDSKATIQSVSANPYGYGRNFAEWHNHITKLRFSYNYNKKLKFLSSLRVFWGIKGAKDMADYNMATSSSTTSNTYIPNYAYYKLPIYDNDTSAFGVSAYFNLSLRYRYNKQTTLSLHGYNLLGLFDEDINKRNYFQTTSNFFDEAPALSLSLNYKFF